MPASLLHTARKPRRTRPPGVLLPFPTARRKRRTRGLRLRRLFLRWLPGRAAARAVSRWLRNARSGRIRSGGPTISQQLAKNLFLSPLRTYLRKTHEVVITLMLEHLLGKRRILEIYLNVIEWGDGIYGAEAAAQHYLGKSAAALEPKEAARLAAMIPRPRFYSRHPKTPYLKQRAKVLVAQMEHVRIP